MGNVSINNLMKTNEKYSREKVPRQQHQCTHSKRVIKVESMSNREDDHQASGDHHKNNQEDSVRVVGQHASIPERRKKIYSVD